METILGLKGKALSCKRWECYCCMLYGRKSGNKNLVISNFDEIEFSMSINSAEKTAFHCVFEINIRLLVSYNFFSSDGTVEN